MIRFISVKKFFLVIFIFVLAYIIFNLFENTPFFIVKEILKKEKYPGKTLVFDLKYLGFLPFGKAVFEDKGEVSFKGKKLRLLTLTAKSTGLASKFFKAKAEIKSYLEPEKLYPLFFIQHIEVPNHLPDYKEIIYDQTNHIMELEGVKRIILPNTHDPLSAIFYMGNQDFKIGQIFDLNLNTNQKNYSIKVRVTKNIKMKVKDEEVSLWIVTAEVKRRDASPMHMHSSSYTIWFLDDAFKIPVLVKAMTNIGYIIIRLI